MVKCESLSCLHIALRCLVAFFEDLDGDAKDSDLFSRILCFCSNEKIALADCVFAY
jgi:hypothetical protein